MHAQFGQDGLAAPQLGISAGRASNRAVGSAAAAPAWGDLQGDLPLPRLLRLHLPWLRHCAATQRLVPPCFPTTARWPAPRWTQATMSTHPIALERRALLKYILQVGGGWGSRVPAQGLPAGRPGARGTTSRCLHTPRALQSRRGRPLPPLPLNRRYRASTRRPPPPPLDQPLPLARTCKRAVWRCCCPWAAPTLMSGCWMRCPRSAC